MTDRATYTVRIRRDPEDPGYWLAECVDEDRVHTFGRSITEARAQIVDALALWFHREADNFEVDYRVELPDDLNALVNDVVARRRRIRELEASVGEDLQEAARRLTEDAGLTMRDAAALLEISHQRVAQLVRDAATA